MTIGMSRFIEDIHNKMRMDACRKALMGAAIGNALGYAVETGYCTDMDVRPHVLGFRVNELAPQTGKAMLSPEFLEMLNVLEAMLKAYEGKSFENAAPDDLEIIRSGIAQEKNMQVRMPESGCMLRMIPVALLCHGRGSLNAIAALGAEAAAITHIHPKSYRYAAAFAHMLAYEAKGFWRPAGLYGSLWNCAGNMKQLFGGRWTMSTWQMQRTLERMKDGEEPAAVNRNPGARKAFYISLACISRHFLDFTGAVTEAARYGSIVGAMTGCLWMLNNYFQNQEEEWIEDLEMADRINDLASRMVECADRMRDVPLSEKKPNLKNKP